ncbi:unnamed protein product [Rotaria magnacalcarata]|uniref:Methyltransferase domain-containing protein n=1 Tax=Rotaria magnacalcarata TaxID=392030 RepID=A0A819I3P1_9BILA|nr:unnamed protein product [Rotaria magnacalcarata]CAF2259581.1 unnamed protein product [Rotaria magnacalcarata]CAF3912561.1 unnamed protein product [Rotaria magnacalcarata]CAF4068795.1 unnamed protein product [Rotaria magnacalcarata]
MPTSFVVEIKYEGVYHQQKTTISPVICQPMLFIHHDVFTSQMIKTKLLSDITEKRILHLQCHFSFDTASLARLDAKQIIGVDLSDVAIDKARQLAEQTDLSDRIQFVCCDIYELETHLPVGDGFDLVVTSFGTVKGLPELKT